MKLNQLNKEILLPKGPKITAIVHNVIWVPRVHLTLHQTLFLLIDSDAPSKDWMQADKASCDNPWNTALWWKKRETHRVAALRTQGKRSGWPALVHWVRLRHWGALVPGSLSRPTHTAYRFETCTSQNTHVTLPLYSLSSYPSRRALRGWTQWWVGRRALAPARSAAGCFLNM